MIPWLLQRIEAAINYEEEDRLVYKAHAGLKLLALLVSWAAILEASTPAKMAVALVYPLALHPLAGWRRAKYAFIASILPTAFVATAVFLISPYKPLTTPWLERGLVLTGRVYGLSSGTLLSFSTTTPVRLASLFARRAPLLHDITLLLYRLAPQAASDLATAYASQRLLGKGLRDPLTGSVLAQLKRGSMIEYSLYSRGMTPGSPRTPIDDGGRIQYGLLLLLASLAVAFAALLP